MSELVSTTAVILAPPTREDRACDLLFMDTSNIARRAFGIGNAVTYTGLTFAPFAAKVIGVLPEYHMGLAAMASIVAGAAGGIARNSNVGILAKMLEIHHRNIEAIDAGKTVELEDYHGTFQPLRKINYDFGMYAAPRGSDQKQDVVGPMLAGMYIGIKENGATRFVRQAIKLGAGVGVWAISGAEYAYEMVAAKSAKPGNVKLQSFDDLKRKWGTGANAILRKLHIKGRKSTFMEEDAVRNIAARVNSPDHAPAPRG